MKTNLLDNELSIELIHKKYKEWISELDFIYDEQLFFEEIISSHFIELCNLDLYNKSKEIINRIKLKRKETDQLRSTIHTNKKRLITQLESQNPKGENYFKGIHQEISKEIHHYKEGSNVIKLDTYDLIKQILVKNKQKKIDK